AASTAEVAARREQAILARLRGDDRFGTAWKRSRVIWRAGELRLRAAEPLLWPFLRGESGSREAEGPAPCGSWGSWGARPPQAGAGGEPEFLGYSAAWALGRCGSASSLPELRAFIDDPATPAAARRIALESVRLLLTPEERAEAARQALD